MGGFEICNLTPNPDITCSESQDNACPSNATSNVLIRHSVCESVSNVGKRSSLVMSLMPARILASTLLLVCYLE